MPDTKRLSNPQWAKKIRRLTFVEVFKKYRKQITHEETGLPFELTVMPDHNETQKLSFDTSQGLKIAVALFTPICLLVFVLSHFWDHYDILSTCSIAGLIGFGTNWVAIKMLFWPREARPIFRHGLIPSQRDQIIEKITNEVLGRLINEELIRQKIVESGVIRKLTVSVAYKFQSLTENVEFREDSKDLVLSYVERLLNDEEFRTQVRDSLEVRIEEFVGHTIKEWFLLKMKRVWKDSLVSIIDREIENLPDILSRILERSHVIFERLPKTIEEHKDAIEVALTRMQMGLIQEINIRSIVIEQLETITTEELETGFREFSDDKFSFITILGGILGLIGGLVILWPKWSLLAIGSALLFICALDQMLYSFFHLKNRD